MDRREFLKLASFGVAASFVSLTSPAFAADAARRRRLRRRRRIRDRKRNRRKGNVDRSGLPPNILFVVTDDQLLETVRWMPKTRRLLAGRGMTFERAYAADPVCAPARASVLSGKHVHNHRVYDNNNTDQTQKRIEADSLAVRLNRLGYRTGLFGKYNTDPATKSRRVPPGWDAFHSFVFPRNDEETLWFNSNGERRGAPIGSGSDCTILGGMASSFIKNSNDTQSPWFCYVATSSPHGPYMPSERHERAFRNELLPKPPNYDEADLSDKPKKFRQKYPRISEKDQAAIREEWRGTLRECQDVDDMVADLVGALERTGELENTLVAYLTDNGYPYGHNRAWSGKGWPYSSMTRLPFFVRGPGVPEGVKSDALVSQIDLLPTCMELAEGEWEDTDGRPLQPLFAGGEGSERNRLLINHYLNQEWKAMIEQAPPRLYVEHSTGEIELYDLANDPYETESLHASEDPETLSGLSDRLAAMADSAGEAYRDAEA